MSYSGREMGQITDKSTQGIGKHWPAASRFALLSLVCFNLVWLSLVMFRYQGILPAILLMALMFACKPLSLTLLQRTVLIAMSGITIDSLLSLAGIFLFPDTIMPLWLIVLWCAFALALSTAFSFVLNWSLALQILAGAFASLNYLAGLVLGAVDYGWPVLQTQILLALIWAALLPFFCLLLNYRRNTDE